MFLLVMFCIYMKCRERCKGLVILSFDTKYRTYDHKIPITFIYLYIQQFIYQVLHLYISIYIYIYITSINFSEHKRIKVLSRVADV